MGLSHSVSDLYVEQSEEVLRLRNKVKSLQMEIDLCHLWLDAADIPRKEPGPRGGKPTRKTLLQRLAIFIALWVDRENYFILRDNIDNLIRDPSGKNMYLAPLSREVLNNENGDNHPGGREAQDLE